MTDAERLYTRPSPPHPFPASTASANTVHAFEALLEYLNVTRGFDFSGYKRASLQRRIRHRMQQVGAASYPEYIAQLETHADELVQLVNTVLITVTAFFRDEPSWVFLSNVVIPRILAHKGPRAQIRIWSAGCATGQEPYSLAMVFANNIGIDQLCKRVKIYATDVDADALAFARLGVYSPRATADIPHAWRDTYFERIDSRYAIHHALRQAVTFDRNDLTRDVPVPRVDLLVCRNTLMYFDNATQSRVLRKFHAALRESGALFLGRAETSLIHTDAFSPLDLKQRLFIKSRRRRILPVGNGGATR